MIVSYRQDDGSMEQVSTNALSAIEAVDVQQALGGTSWRAIEDDLRAQDPNTMRAVLWAFRRRAQPDLEFAEFDVPGWRRRLTVRIERVEIDDVLDHLMVEGLGKNEDSAIKAMLPHLRKLAHDRADVDAALDALGKGHLVQDPEDSAA